MESKLLRVIQIADELNSKQDKEFAEIEYTADSKKKLQILIRSKEDFSYIEKCEIYLANNALIKWDNIIELFEKYVGGAENE